MNHLDIFSPLKLRDLEIRNRVFVSPMCQYSAVNGIATDWHRVHLGSLAVGGPGLVVVESTGVEAEGRITHGCLGLWNSEQAEALRPIVNFIHGQGAKIAIQLNHAGRKASHEVPWRGGKFLPPEKSGWTRMAPSAQSYHPTDPAPKELSVAEISSIKQKFIDSARLAMTVGFDAVELHFAHGYLAHQFLSPLSNFRNDIYGGPLENRMRFPLQVASQVREVLPPTAPLLVRISATDWCAEGWDLPQSIAFCKELKAIGVDLVDVSSGGLTPQQKIAVGPHYQVPFAKEIRAAVQMPIGAVGMITDPEKANGIVTGHEADAISLAREFLRDPHWPLRAAHVLNREIPWPQQYERAKW